MRTMWIDASAGVAGDMLLGALVDAGVALEALQHAVDAVLPGSVRLAAGQVDRAGMRATKVDVEVLVDDPPHRTWTTIRGMLERAVVDDAVRARALAAFARLAEAEGHVHGTPPEDVHFHEVGALDSIADVVGTCAGVVALGLDQVVVSPIAVGSGSMRAHHGTLPVPPPAVLALARGWEVLADGDGELATPTGTALVTSLASRSGPMPPMRVELVGVGAGTRDRPGRANVVRIVVGAGPAGAGRPSPADAHAEGGVTDAVVIEANVDDLDPRLWPDVLTGLLDLGASDAWLTPVVMKKGRPASTLHVLAAPELEDDLTDAVLRTTSTLGVRRTSVRKTTLARDWVEVTTSAGVVRVKVGHRDGLVVQATPEYDDVVRLGADSDVPVRAVLQEAGAAAHAAGLRPGAPWPVR